MKEEIQEVTNFLMKNGYTTAQKHQFRNNSVNHFKVLRMDEDGIEHVCMLNDKVQLVAEVHANLGIITIEVSITQETNFNAWVDLKIYSLTKEDVFSNLVMYEQKLIEAWNNIND